MRLLLVLLLVPAVCLAGSKKRDSWGRFDQDDFGKFNTDDEEMDDQAQRTADAVANRMAPYLEEEKRREDERDAREDARDYRRYRSCMDNGGRVADCL